MDNLLLKLTGLSDEDLAKTLIANSRAYMALRGAVAERHLLNYFAELKSSGKVSEFVQGTSDSEKDFYIHLKGMKQKVVVECKNVEVLKLKKMDRDSYFKYIKGATSKNNPLSGEINTYDELPQEYKQSGIYRYMYSAQDFDNQPLPRNQNQLVQYLSQSSSPLSVDFQRTRNSSDGSGKTVASNRFYRKNEIDILAVCLFSRTLKWEFIFIPSSKFPVHPKHKMHYHNRFTINPKDCYLNLIDLLKN